MPLDYRACRERQKSRKMEIVSRILQEKASIHKQKKGQSRTKAIKSARKLEDPGVWRRRAWRYIGQTCSHSAGATPQVKRPRNPESVELWGVQAAGQAVLLPGNHAGCHDHQTVQNTCDFSIRSLNYWESLFSWLLMLVWTKTSSRWVWDGFFEGNLSEEVNFQTHKSQQASKPHTKYPPFLFNYLHPWVRIQIGLSAQEKCFHWIRKDTQNVQKLQSVFLCLRSSF